MLFTTPGAGWTDPFRELERMRQEMERTYGDARLGRTREFPPMNLLAGENGVVVTAQIPGVDPDQVEITVHQNTLTLKGDRQPDATGDDIAYHRRERTYGNFARTVALPFRVDPDKVEARFDAGIVSIVLPRPEVDKPRRVRINRA